MIKFERILVPLDGSACAEMILPTVEKFAADYKSSIALVQAVFVRSFPGKNLTEAEMEAVKQGEDYLKKMAEQLKAKGYKVDTHVRYGDPAEEILEHASQKDIDMVAMTTHGRSGVKRFLLGSVVSKILRHSPKPIFLVRCG